MSDDNAIPSPFFGEAPKPEGIPTMNPYGIRVVVFMEVAPGSGHFQQLAYNSESMVRILNSIQKEMPTCDEHPGEVDHFMTLCNSKFKYFSHNIPDSYTDEELRKMYQESEKDDEHHDGFNNKD